MADISDPHAPITKVEDSIANQNATQKDNSKLQSGTRTSVKGPGPPSTKGKTEEERKESRERLRTVFIVLSFVGMCIALGVAWSARSAAHESARNAKRSADAVEQSARGYLSILEIKMDTFKPNEPIGLFIIWRNDGNLPVTISESISKIGIGLGVPPADLCEGTQNVSIGPFVVPPHNTRIQTVSTRATDFTPDQIQAVIASHAYFVICGKVVYQTAGQTLSFPLCSYIKSSMPLFMECGTRWKE